MLWITILGYAFINSPAWIGNDVVGKMCRWSSSFRSAAGLILVTIADYFETALSKCLTQFDVAEVVSEDWVKHLWNRFCVCARVLGIYILSSRILRHSKNVVVWWSPWKCCHVLTQADLHVVQLWCEYSSSAFFLFYFTLSSSSFLSIRCAMKGKQNDLFFFFFKIKMMKWHRSAVAGVAFTSISDFICKQSNFYLFLSRVMFYGFYICASVQVYLIDMLFFFLLKSVKC